MLTHDLKNTERHLNTLGERLRYRRHQVNLTQENLAQKAGTNQAVIQKIENGRSLRPRRIHQIAAVLDINPAWLMFGEDQATPLPKETRKLAEMWVKLPTTERQRIFDEVYLLANKEKTKQR